MNRSDVIDIEGTIGELMPSDRFSVLTDDGHLVLAALSGALARQAWAIKVGDRVTVQLAVDRPIPGRIFRLAKQAVQQPAGSIDATQGIESGADDAAR